MDSRKIARIAICALLLCLILAAVIETAEAGPAGQKGQTQPDSKSPTKAQMMLGVGSVIVAIIVLKWL